VVVGSTARAETACLLYQGQFNEEMKAKLFSFNVHNGGMVISLARGEKEEGQWVVIFQLDDEYSFQ
jgi:hypothetical protein